MILRVCLCVPTFDNPLTIETVTLDAIEQTAFPILIVDDGSQVPVREQLRSPQAITALQSGRLRVLRLEKNGGKGLAIQFAIKDCVRNDYTHMLTIDGDGQHHVSEVSKLVNLAKNYPWDLIIGNRKLEADSVPGVSKFGRGFSNFWVGFQTGHRISDSQSGFRLYPLFHLQTMNFWTKRYDFEIEVLIRLMWRGVEVRETEIEVFYPKKEERVSHFNKLWDNVRISCLNTFLVVISLLKTHRSPREAALAMGTGVLIGCTPFFGLHMLIVAAVSFFFRLNAGFLFLGSQISIPLTAPFLVAASIWVGAHLTFATVPPLDFSSVSFRHVLEFGAVHFLQWFLGSLVIGALLGTIIGVLTYFTMRKLRNAQKNRVKWTGRTRGGKFGNGFLKIVLKTMGLRAGYFILLFIVPYFYFFAPEGRRGLNEYWSLTNPQAGWWKRQFLITKHFYRFGQVLMDRGAQSFSPFPLFKTTSNGTQNIDEPLKQKRGLILLGAHVGGWDLSASLLNRGDPAKKMHVLEYRAAALTFNDIKGKQGSEHLSQFASNEREHPIFDLHSLLDRREPIGLMGDRPIGARIELVSFLGKLAPFDVTAFRLAAATQTPLLVTISFKTGPQSYSFRAFPAHNYRYEAGIDRNLQCYNWLQEYVKTLEISLRTFPEQWFNFYRFWSSSPVNAVLSGAREEGGGMKTRAQNSLIEELHKPSWPKLELVLGAKPNDKVKS